MGFSLLKGLERLIPDVKIKGAFKENTEREYEAIIILNDGVEKPLYDDVYTAALNAYREEIASKIDEKTQYYIVYEFEFSDAPGIKFKADLAWQFNTQNLYLIRNNLTYPYNLKVSSKENAEPIYIELTDVTQFEKLYNEFFAYVKTWLESGREEKAKIAAMTKEELDAYIDTRDNNF